MNIGSQMFTNQWFKLFLGNQIEFGDKVVEMLITSIDMSFSSNGDQAIEVMYIYMNENPEKSG